MFIVLRGTTFIWNGGGWLSWRDFSPQLLCVAQDCYIFRVCKILIVYSGSTSALRLPNTRNRNKVYLTLPKIFVGLGWFSVNINLYGTTAEHGWSWVQKGNTFTLVSLACPLYCELLVTVSRVHMLVEKVCVCSLQTNVESSTCMLPPPERRDWRGTKLAMTRSATTALTGDSILQPKPCW